mmetsp:Transcript_431/g.811  ORF Transcript_431/g.811 Transcript_431/m.811 type:complete len:346 (+) Transcript_431:377-1414(+)
MAKSRIALRCGTGLDLRRVNPHLFHYLQGAFKAKLGLAAAVQGTPVREFLHVVPIFGSILDGRLSFHQVIQTGSRFLCLVMDAKLSHIFFKHIFAGDVAATIWILCTKLGLVVQADSRVHGRVALVHTEDRIMGIEDHDLVEGAAFRRKLLDELHGCYRGRAHPHVYRNNVIRRQVPRQFHNNLRPLRCFDEPSAVLFGDQHRWNVNHIPIAIIRHDDVCQISGRVIRVLSVNDDDCVSSFCLCNLHLGGEGAVSSSYNDNVDEPDLVLPTSSSLRLWRRDIIILLAAEVFARQRRAVGQLAQHPIPVKWSSEGGRGPHDPAMVSEGTHQLPGCHHLDLAMGNKD